MTDQPNEETERMLLRVRLPDGTEAVFQKAADSSQITVPEALSAMGDRFQELADRIKSGSADSVANAEFDAELNAQIRELTRHDPLIHPPTTRELAQRIEELEQRISELENDRPRQ